MQSKHTFSVGKRYTVTLRYEGDRLRADWAPSYPPEDEWHGKLLDDYLTGYCTFVVRADNRGGRAGIFERLSAYRPHRAPVTN